eukprot:TRINITY_DN5743_c0_g1_i2.p1 TRINITY_DN5743_c0_g1~~TRINITY_DN5743_c0_g1_i2.p1  ORF type:complete len:771 (-),score=126.05 TRINITY_DN5743_c0_g1_i2:180-2492(-)
MMIHISIYLVAIDITSLESTILQSRGARVKNRFPAPVILLGRKYICRSSTLSRGVEVILKDPQSKTKQLFNHIYDYYSEKDIERHSFIQKERNHDITLLQNLRVQHICDLMVEDRKRCYGLYVCSSEKVDQYNRYEKAKFLLNSIPYPGVEFFTKYRDNHYQAEDLYFDWNDPCNTAEITIRSLNMFPWRWAEYRDWDLIKLTQAYVYLIMSYLADPISNLGLLIHCISGWDRTPLFVSLVRLLLWAEGEIHPSLSVDEILYLNITYDWFLFCHQFCHRFSRGEDIFHFCFEFLKYATADEYSLAYHRREASKASSVVDEELSSSVLATYKNGTWFENSMMRMPRSADVLSGSTTRLMDEKSMDGKDLEKDLVFDMEGDDMNMEVGDAYQLVGERGRPKSDQFWVVGRDHMKPEASFFDELLKQSSLQSDYSTSFGSRKAAAPQTILEDDLLAHDVYRISGASVEQHFVLEWSDEINVAASPEAVGSWEIISEIERRRTEEHKKRQMDSHLRGGSKPYFASSSAPTEHFEARPLIDEALSSSVKLVYTNMKDGLVPKPIVLEDYDGCQIHESRPAAQSAIPIQGRNERTSRTSGTHTAAVTSSMNTTEVKEISAQPAVRDAQPLTTEAISMPMTSPHVVRTSPNKTLRREDEVGSEVDDVLLLLSATPQSEAPEIVSPHQPAPIGLLQDGTHSENKSFAASTPIKMGNSSSSVGLTAGKRDAVNSFPGRVDRRERLLQLRMRFLELYVAIIGPMPNSSGGIWTWLNAAVA